MLLYLLHGSCMLLLVFTYTKPSRVGGIPTISARSTTEHSIAMTNQSLAPLTAQPTQLSTFTSSTINSPERRIASVPMRRSVASMGIRPVDIVPRRVPVSYPETMTMTRTLPYGGVPMERSTASMGTDSNPYLRRGRAREPRTPSRRVLGPISVPYIQTLLPSPPPSPTPSRYGENVFMDMELKTKDAPHAPSSRPDCRQRQRRKRGLSAPPSNRLFSPVDTTRSLRVTVSARIPLRAVAWTSPTNSSDSSS